MKKCEDGCTYSKSMYQKYPRLCIECGYPEESNIDTEQFKIRNTCITDSGILALALRFLNQRDMLIQNFQSNPGSEFPKDAVEYCNNNIKSLLNL